MAHVTWVRFRVQWPTKRRRHLNQIGLFTYGSTESFRSAVRFSVGNDFKITPQIHSLSIKTPSPPRQEQPAQPQQCEAVRLGDKRHSDNRAEADQVVCTGEGGIQVEVKR